MIHTLYYTYILHGYFYADSSIRIFLYGFFYTDIAVHTRRTFTPHYGPKGILDNSHQLSARHRSTHINQNWWEFFFTVICNLLKYIIYYVLQQSNRLGWDVIRCLESDRFIIVFEARMIVESDFGVAQKPYKFPGKYNINVPAESELIFIIW